MNKLISESVKVIIEKVVKECSMHYGFDSKDAMIRLGLVESAEVVVERPSTPILKRSVVDSVKKEKKIPLPYSGENNSQCCSGLNLNQGLYTQCEKKKKINDLCEACDKQAKKNESGKPDYGRIEDRQQVGLMDYRDPKGKGPIAYIKIMKKLGLTKEEILEEAKKRNQNINEVHFEEEKIVSEEDKKKGRPKKSKKVLEVEGETNDLFLELIASVSTPEAEKEPLSLSLPTVKENDEAKVVETSPTVVVETSPKKKEKVVKEKVVKEKVVKEKVVKEKVVKEKVVKEKVKKDSKKPSIEIAVPVVDEKEILTSSSTPTSSSPEDEEEADVVKRFEYKGIKYLKSKKTGIIYNMEQELVGKWNEETQKIDFEAEEEEEEEEEDEYDE